MRKWIRSGVGLVVLLSAACSSSPDQQESADETSPGSAEALSSTASVRDPHQTSTTQTPSEQPSDAPASETTEPTDDSNLTGALPTTLTEWREQSFPLPPPPGGTGDPINANFDDDGVNAQCDTTPYVCITLESVGVSDTNTSTGQPQAAALFVGHDSEGYPLFLTVGVFEFSDEGLELVSSPAEGWVSNPFFVCKQDVILLRDGDVLQHVYDCPDGGGDTTVKWTEDSGTLYPDENFGSS